MALAKGLAFYCNGINLATNAIKSFDAAGEAEELDTTTLGSSMRSFVTGFQTGTISAEGVWAHDAVNLDEIHDIFHAAFTTGNEAVITATLATPAVGVDTILMTAVETSYNLPAEVGALIMVDANFRSVSGFNAGKWLFSAEVDTSLTDGTSVDNGAATANGGIFHVHYQGGSETEDLTAKIQHSANDLAWADLGTVTATNVATFGAQALEIAAGTSVNRYIRAQVQVAQGALTVQAAFARR